MASNIRKSDLTKISIIYLLIIGIINFLGYLVASSGSMPTVNNADFDKWIAFMDAHRALINIMGASAFIIPTLLCVVYSRLGHKEDIAKKIINLPVVYSVCGSLGWMTSLLVETLLLIYLHVQGYLNMKSIWLSSAFNMFLTCIFISTFAFLILDLISRKAVLPKYFPDGNLSQYKGAISLSSKVLFVIFYLSIGAFPVGFLVSTIYNLSLTYDFTVRTGVLHVILLILLMGIGLTVLFTDHFSNPLRKLKHATEAMTDSNYAVKVDVVSSDEFGTLADAFNDMTVSLDEKSKKILAIQDSIIRGMAVMVEQRDNSTGGHINRTSDCVKVFMDYIEKCDDYAFTPSFVKAVVKAAPMHDLGKIAVDDEVLRKPGRFTDEEYEIMKGHAAAGQHIVDMVLAEVDDQEFKSVTRNVAHYHHEKWDGTGYPEKISGEDIPIEARIMALADVFDALVSKRCYKDAMSYDKAFDIIEHDLGTHFDPKLGRLFLQCKDDLIALYESYHDQG